MQIGEIKLLIEIVSDILTILAILVGGIWTFLIFVVGRNHSPNIQLAIQWFPISTGEQSTVLLTVTAKNIGQTLVIKERCYLFITSISQPFKNNQSLASRIDPPNKNMLLQNPPTFEIFSNTQSLNPHEHVDEHILLDLNSSCNLYKVCVEFYNKPRVGKQLSWFTCNIFKYNKY